jgi:hypothetical protein
MPCSSGAGIVVVVHLSVRHARRMMMARLTSGLWICVTACICMRRPLCVRVHNNHNNNKS